jgi:quercetin 2,3-dioxygenase
MKQEASARFYPGAGRGLTDNESFRSHYTFPFGRYQDAGKPPFGPLYLLNDETLAPEQQLRLQPEERTLLLLLPVTGAVDYRDTDGNDALLPAGQAGIFTLDAGSSYRLRNPYDASLVHYLQLWIAWPAAAPLLQEKVAFDLAGNRNKLVEIRNCAGAGFRLSLRIGRFDEKGQATISATSGDGLFGFVLQGHFSVPGYELEAGDGLALWNTGEATFESRSDDGLLLLVQLGPIEPEGQQAVNNG